MLLLELQMKPIKASQASWFIMRMPVNLGAFLAKLESEVDHCVYNALEFSLRLK